MTGKLMSKMIDLTLPAFAFVEGSSHEKNNELDGRNVILHIRSASVIEILDRDSLIGVKEGVLTYKFCYTNFVGVKEEMIALLHYCTTLDMIANAELIKNEIMKPAAKWYCEYCKWEDNNILEDGV